MLWIFWNFHFSQNLWIAWGHLKHRACEKVFWGQPTFNKWLLRNAEIFRSRQISQSRLRLFVLDLDVETKLRSRDLDRDFATVETHFLTLSNFSRQSRCTLWQRRDRDSQSRYDRDKLRPPGLHLCHVVDILKFSIFHKASSHLKHRARDEVFWGQPTFNKWFFLGFL
jgi:hypothetical protein